MNIIIHIRQYGIQKALIIKITKTYVDVPDTSSGYDLNLKRSLWLNKLKLYKKVSAFSKEKLLPNHLLFDYMRISISETLNNNFAFKVS